jgi:hypothetical protein
MGGSSATRRKLEPLLTQVAAELGMDAGAVVVEVVEVRVSRVEQLPGVEAVDSLNQDYPRFRQGHPSAGS